MWTGDQGGLEKIHPAIRTTPLVLKNLEWSPHHVIIHKNAHSSWARRSTVGMLASVLSLLEGEFPSAVFNVDYSSNFKR